MSCLPPSDPAGLNSTFEGQVKMQAGSSERNEACWFYGKLHDDHTEIVPRILGKMLCTEPAARLGPLPFLQYGCF